MAKRGIHYCPNGTTSNAGAAFESDCNATGVTGVGKACNSSDKPAAPGYYCKAGLTYLCPKGCYCLGGENTNTWHVISSVCENQNQNKLNQINSNNETGIRFCPDGYGYAEGARFKAECGFNGRRFLNSVTLRNYNDSATYETVYKSNYYDTEKHWYADSNGERVISSVDVPERSGYTFMGFFSKKSNDFVQTGGTSEYVIPHTGILPSSFYNNQDMSFYAVWAKDCEPGLGCNCTLKISDNGYATYTTSAQLGYKLTSGSGTYKPVCEKISCQIGKYLEEGTSSCKTCPIGYKCPGDNQKHQCQDRTYASTTGQSQCTYCPLPDVVVVTGAGLHTGCNPRQYAVVNERTTLSDIDITDGSGVVTDDDDTGGGNGGDNGGNGGTAGGDNGGNGGTAGGGNGGVVTPEDPVSCTTPGEYLKNGVCADCESDYFCPGNGNHYPCPLGGNSTSLDGKSCSVNVTKTQMYGNNCWKYTGNASSYRNCVYGIRLEDYRH